MAVVINANKTGETDGSMANMLNRINCHTPIVIVSRCENFVFNDELLGLDKYVLVNASEMGWDYDWGRGTPIFGRANFAAYSDLFKGDDYMKLHLFAMNRQPLISFNRELLKKDATQHYQPIEYPSWHIAPLQSEEEFNTRPLEVFFNWGLSNPSRPMLHGDIWNWSHREGYSVCDNLYNLNAFIEEERNQRKWLTVNTPHYARFPIEKVLEVNGIAKISVCMWGAGRKCFRTTGESPINAVMILPEDDMAYQFEWKNGVNCIKIQPYEIPVEAINEATKRKDLYEIYKNGHATCEKYQVGNYTKHLAEIINSL